MASVAFLTEVRNCEKYLPQAIESILQQTYRDFIYYIVDDGSTDATRDVIAHYAEQDSRIRSFYWENDMIGNFNRALEIIYASDADYFALLDSDDWYEADFAQCMVEALETTGADLAEVKFTPHDEDGTEQEPIAGFGNLLFTLEDFAHDFAYYSFFDSVQQWWGKLYRISIMRKLALMAGPGWDNAFVLRYRAGCKKYAALDRALHHYRIRPDSDCHKKIHTFDSAKVVAALTEQQQARLDLLAAGQCENPDSFLMSQYQDINGVKSNMMRLYAGDVPDVDAAAGIYALLSMSSLAQAYTAIEETYQTHGTFFSVQPQDCEKAMESIRSYYGHFFHLMYWYLPQMEQDFLFGWICRVFPHLGAFFEQVDLPLLMQDCAIPIWEKRYHAALVGMNGVDATEEGALLRVFCAVKLHTDRRFFKNFCKIWKNRLSIKKWRFLSLQTRGEFDIMIKK